MCLAASGVGKTILSLVPAADRRARDGAEVELDLALAALEYRVAGAMR